MRQFEVEGINTMVEKGKSMSSLLEHSLRWSKVIILGIKFLIVHHFALVNSAQLTTRDNFIIFVC